MTLTSCGEEEPAPLHQVKQKLCTNAIMSYTQKMAPQNFLSLFDFSIIDLMGQILRPRKLGKCCDTFVQYLPLVFLQNLQASTVPGYRAVSKLYKNEWCHLKISDCFSSSISLRINLKTVLEGQMTPLKICRRDPGRLLLLGSHLVFMFTQAKFAC